jgi:hypothetical protein
MARTGLQGDECDGECQETLGHLQLDPSKCSLAPSK